MARNDSIHWYPLWRVPPEFSPPEAPSGQVAFRQCLHLGRYRVLLCRLNQFCLSHDR